MRAARVVFFEGAHIISRMMALGVHGDRIKFMLPGQYLKPQKCQSLMTDCLLVVKLLCKVWDSTFLPTNNQSA